MKPSCLSLLSMSCLLAVGTAAAQTQDVDTRSKQPSQLQETVVTGTRMLDRTAADSLAPIDVLSPIDLQTTGATDLSSALRMLLPSFNFPQPSVTDATDATMPAQLRGLAPDHTLVLINGKRQHTTSVVNVNGSIGRGSSPVDINAIPINAIDHIEVLRDGAAAQYGSDAIAGVINIILKSGAEGGSAILGGGQYDRGDGRTWNAGADAGLAIGAEGWLHASVNATRQQPTSRAGRDVRFPDDPSYDTVTFKYGLPESKAQQAAVNLQYSFSPQAELYGFALVNHRSVRAGGFFRSLSTYAGTYPGAEATYPDGYLPIENSDIHDDSEVLGLRGTVGDWHYDVSYNGGGNHWKLHTSDTWNYSLDPGSPTGFYIGTLSNRQDMIDADFSRTFAAGNVPLTLAFGLEHRREEFRIKEGDGASYVGTGAQVYPGYQPGDAGKYSRHNNAAYLDLEGDFSDRFSAGLAVRHERYSDFGNTTSWKGSARYAFTNALALRGTASTGFRAPSLGQGYYSSTAINFVNDGSGTLVPYTIRTFPVTDPAAVALGAQPLRPEKSRNYSLGLVLTPDSGFYATLDLYQIDIDHRIILSGNLVGTPVEDYLTSVGIPFVSGGRFFTNAVDTRTRGADLVASWPFDVGAGSMKFTAGLNWNKTTLERIAPNPPQLGLAGLTLPIIDRAEIGRITVGTPRTKAFVADDWNVGNWTVHSQLTRYGEWTVYGGAPSTDQTFDPRYLLDLSASYHFDNWRVTLGGNNITNTYPERNSAANNFSGILPYPLTSPFGFSGAYYYASIGLDW